MAKTLLLMITAIILAGIILMPDADAYVVGPGDVLKIDVFKHAELSNAGAKIEQDGCLNLALLGKVQVNGKTVENVQALLTTLYKKDYLQNPKLTVIIKEYQSQKIFITGDTRTPSHFVLKGEMKLVDVLTSLTSLPEGTSEVFVLRKLDKPEEVEKEKQDKEKTKEKDKGKDKAKATTDKKAVKDPKAKETKPEEKKVTEKKKEEPKKIDKAKGSVLAKQNRLQTKFRKKTIFIDLRKLYLGYEEENIVMQKDDILYFPREGSISLIGKVKQPGTVKFTGGLMLTELITNAGGLEDSADSDIIIYRETKDGKTKLEVDFDEATKGKDFEMQPGDIVIIEESWI